jgi:hypothetical protein
MKVVEYLVPIGIDGRRRVRHTRFEGKVTEFMVQYEIFVKGKWYEVVRYDKDLNICLTYAENDLRANWKNYRERFLREVARR